jgi:cation:H+ antiporter
MASLTPWQNAVVFAVAAAVIWWSGARLERAADTISARTGLGHAFTGMLLLAGATSLPEVATTVTAVVVLDNPSLAVHNLLGGVAMQTAILVIADGVKPRGGALTFFSPRFALLIQGVGLLMLLQLTVAGIMADGTPAVASVSLWPVLIVGAYVGIAYLVYRDRGHPRWTAEVTDDFPRELLDDVRGAEVAGTDTHGAAGGDERSTVRVWLVFSGLALLVLAGGWAATQSADTLAEQTGLGDAFMGATLLALATSLPEVSTTVAASRNERYTVAVSNIFGSNAFDVTLIALAEILYVEDTVMRHAGDSVVFVAVLGAVLTCIYLWGLMERQNRSARHIGWDSLAVLVVYIGGVAVLYFISSGGGAG